MCCLFGILDYAGRLTSRDRYRVTRSLAIAAEIRGTDATGIATLVGDRLLIQKAPKAARRFRFNIREHDRIIMGHTRMTTQGDEKRNRNNHPFLGSARDTQFALAHNGIIYNDKALRRANRLPDTTIETDSYIAVQLLEHLCAVTADNLASVAEVLDGSFTLTVLSRHGLDIVRGNNPLCLYRFPQLGFYAYASTEEILTHGLSMCGLDRAKHEDVPLRQGDILRLTPDGNASKTRFDDSSLSFYDLTWRCAVPSVDFDDDYLEMLTDYALSLGIPESELEMLLESGFGADEIEEMLFDDAYRRECLDGLRGVTCVPYGYTQTER
ncbi:MAG: class II glutamine amidotransferase [Oscillospiraceae bacterium]|jgi:glutamine phosphoribosylpyrophosphate amidotransferase|nr:class II glutamine amidotransferase [Oscillospiraceae bacterium]